MISKVKRLFDECQICFNGLNRNSSALYKSELKNLYFNWYEQSMILFNQLGNSSTVDKFQAIDNGGNVYSCRDNFNRVRGIWNLLIQQIENMEECAKEANSKVFIVHGHDEALTQQVARFVEKLGFNAIILHERANKGNTIIEKIEDCADTASFAIILYTGCDKGTAKNSDELKPRARQNVIFEHGFFVGKLGRDHVCCLYEEGVELPGDLSGIAYIPADINAAWQTKVAKEMNAAGLPVDMNKLIK